MDGAPASPAAMDPDDVVLAHEPLDSFAPDPDVAAEAELGVHLGRAVGLPRPGVDVADDLHQLPIRLRRIEEGRSRQA
jgi:hypothetical protein